MYLEQGSKVTNTMYIKVLSSSSIESLSRIQSAERGLLLEEQHNNIYLRVFLMKTDNLLV